MGNLLPYLFRAAPGILAKGQAGLNARAEKEAKDEERRVELARQDNAQKRQDALAASLETYRQRQEMLLAQKEAREAAKPQEWKPTTREEAEGFYRTTHPEAPVHPAEIPEEGGGVAFVNPKTMEVQRPQGVKMRQPKDPNSPDAIAGAVTRAVAIQQATQQGKRGQPVPPQMVQAAQNNRAAIRQIDAAIAAVKANPTAFGPVNMIPGTQTVRQMTDTPEQIQARAIVAGVGGVKYHDLSGAAVSPKEDARLSHYIPGVRDQAAAALAKLQNLRQEIEGKQRDIDSYYSADKGFIPEGQPSQSAGPTHDDVLKKYGLTPKRGR